VSIGARVPQGGDADLLPCDRCAGRHNTADCVLPPRLARPATPQPPPPQQQPPPPPLPAVDPGMLHMFQSLIAHLDGKRAEEQHRADERLAQEQRRAEERLEERLSQERRAMDERHALLVQAVLAGNSGRPSRDADPAADRSRPSDEKLRLSDITGARKDLTQFKGGDVTRVEVDDFLTAQEHFSELSFHDDSRFLAHMRTQLLGGARTWFDTLDPKPETQVDFVKKFRERWYPIGSAAVTRKALQELRMTGTTSEFISAWRSLMADMTALVAASTADGNKKAVFPSDDELMEWFTDGLSKGNKRARALFTELRSGLQVLLHADKEPTIHDAVKIVERSDRYLKLPDNRSEHESSGQRRPHKRDAEVSAASGGTEPIKRARTKPKGRIAAAPKDVPDSEVTCFNCGKKGHRIAACKAPLLKPKALVHAVGLDQRCYGDLDMEAFQVAHAGVDSETDAAPQTDASSDDDADFPPRA
jgi:hypothetical protein